MIGHRVVNVQRRRSNESLGGIESRYLRAEMTDGHDRILFDRPGLRVGLFSCARDDPSFEDSGPARGHLFVFPHTSVTIAHDGGKPLVADANSVMFYNREQVYRRGPLHPEGDTCCWFSVGERSLRDALEPYDPGVRDRSGPFGLRRGAATTTAYLRHRRLTEYLERDPDPDPTRVECATLALLDEVLAAAYPWRRPTREGTRTHRELTEAVKAVLAACYSRPITLERIARTLEVSPYHMNRVFRRQSGQTPHAYLTQLRVRAALARLGDGEALIDVAAHCGFSSHSHFSATFRRIFGATPSGIRAELRRARS